MQVARLECFAGISGDMLLGALIDAGAPLERVHDAVAALGLSAEVRISKVNRSGINATKADVLVGGHLAESAAEAASLNLSDAVHTHAGSTHGHHHDQGIGGDHAPHDHDHPAHDHGHHGHDHDHHGHSHRNLKSIRAILATAPLSARARELSHRAFDVLAEAEGRVHGISPDEVHFHEVGAVDAIVDIVGCAVAVDLLDIEHWYGSAVNVGSGFVNCAHGRFPVPAPATAALLQQVPIYSAGPEMEMATPTGAALIRALECRFEPPGTMRSSAIGYGAGTRNPPGFPNVLRLTIGETESFFAVDGSGDLEDEKVTVIECALDDLSPQVLAYTAQLAMERGALDVMTSPVTMKKGRLGTLLSVLCRPPDARGLEELLFRETSTLGMRVREESRLVLTREIVPVQTKYGEIRMKVGSWRGEAINVAPEFEDCRRAAEAGDVPLKSVMQAAMAQWRSNLPSRSTGGAE